MKNNPFKSLKSFGHLPSDSALNVIGPEKMPDPEAHRVRFRKLAALLTGLKPQAGLANPPPVIPPIGPKVPKF